MMAQWDQDFNLCTVVCVGSFLQVLGKTMSLFQKEGLAGEELLEESAKCVALHWQQGGTVCPALPTHPFGTGFDSLL